MSAYLAALGITLGVAGLLMHGIATNSNDADVATAWCRKWYGTFYHYALAIILLSITGTSWQLAFLINR